MKDNKPHAEENDSFTLLKQALPKKFNLEGIQKITFLTSVEYNENSYEVLKLAIQKNDLPAAAKKYSFNPLNDAVEFYLFQENDGREFISTLFSPVEFFENEYIMDFINIDYKLDITKFDDNKVVYE